MRFQAAINGSRRKITFFAIFPVKIGREIRWLEVVTIEQRFGFDERWHTQEFIDKPQEALT